MKRTYKYELQVYCGGWWQSRGHYYTRNEAWQDVADMRHNGDPYRHFKHRVIISDNPYIEEI
ncbi:MAG: hypothetical protein K2H46_02490 [Muribaculaceae bacterium]|nr:hypothetical protein [Muribaculaceae bacterium]